MIRSIARRLRRARDPRLRPVKIRAIDAAFDLARGRTLADLGGVWAVDGGYALYAADRYRLQRTVICDFEFTEPVLKRDARDRRLELIEGDFTRREVAERVGTVDVVLMFDVLLHQVAPDWEEVLELYAGRASCLVVAGPWWNGPETVRLLELGRERYLEVVAVPEFHRPILDRLDEFDERTGRPWRDCPDIWQWGITVTSLSDKLESLGYRLAFEQEAGAWYGSPYFDDRSFVFLAGSA